MYLRTIAEADATGRVAEIYAAQRAQLGFVMATARSFTPRPDLLPIYTEFSDRIRAGFSLGVREWRLITLIAAKHVPSTYCSYVYGRQLVDDLGSKEAVMAVQRDFRTARLPDRDVAMLAYAEQIARNASLIGQPDIDRLRAVGFTDRQICDIALCASFRCFVSRYFDAVGAGPEEVFVDGDATFREALTVGRTY
ncbi:MAG: alkylhydroperoxidase [Microvirga sp.]